MVVERGQGVFQNPDVQKTLQADLQNAQTAICDEHDSRQQEGEGVAALERQQGDEKAQALFENFFTVKTQKINCCD